MNRLFPDGSGVFQQDLAPCHTSKQVKKFMNENHIKVLKWPGNSPDLNPIENLWSICKQRLRTMLHLEGKAYSGSNSSVVQGPPNLKRLFKIGRLNAQTHQNAS